MKQYITTIKKDNITLNIMGRNKTFKKDSKVSENIFTKSYPKYFKLIGHTKGTNFLATPEFVPLPTTFQEPTILTSEIK